MKDEPIYTVQIGKLRAKPPAFAVVDKATRLIRMDDATRALAIFDTRAAARAISRLHKGATMVVPVTLDRVKKN